MRSTARSPTTKRLAQAGVESLRAIGGCLAPQLLAEAVFTGHEAARALDGPDVSDLPLRIEQVPASFEPPMPWAVEVANINQAKTSALV